MKKQDRPENSGPTLTNEEQEQLLRYLAEAKRHLKNYSKNDLIRMIGALLVDNAALKSIVDSQNKPKEAQ